MPEEFATVVRPYLEALLEPEETLDGVIAANLQRTFSGHLCALGVTDRRLVLQPLGRKAEPSGEARSITAEGLASASIRGVADDWWNTEVWSYGALALRLKTSDGEKLKLYLMEGGDGLLGKLGGGVGQRKGVEALALWMRSRFGGG